MSASDHDHRVPGKPAPLSGGQCSSEENFVWKRKGFGLRGVLGLREGSIEGQHFDWQQGKKKSKLKLS